MTAVEKLSSAAEKKERRNPLIQCNLLLLYNIMNDFIKKKILFDHKQKGNNISNSFNFRKSIHFIFPK